MNNFVWENGKKKKNFCQEQKILIKIQYQKERKMCFHIK
jgi:hypothetical protein